MKYLLKLFLCYLPFTSFSQGKFSFATDASMLRNFDGKQGFTVFGQTVMGQWHIDDRSTIYAFISYHLNGKYRSNLVASAKQPIVQPQTISFSNKSEMRLRQISVGLKKYFAGTYETDGRLNLYGMGGFGLIFGRATNSFSTPIDTTQYMVQNNIVNGAGDFKRLSFDIGLGGEASIAYEIFLYSEIRVHIPASDYPSNYLIKNDNAPFLGTFNVGIRILFNSDD